MVLTKDTAKLGYRITSPESDFKIFYMNALTAINQFSTSAALIRKIQKMD